MNQEFIDFINAENSPVFDGLIPALSNPPVRSIRLNPLKHSNSLINKLSGSLNVPWEPLGFYVDKENSFTVDPGLHQGLYYVQDASSMILGEVTRRISRMTGKRPLRVFDSCAAPGGKTTSILSSLPDGSALMANEFDFSRAEILKENLAKWGFANVIVTRGDLSRMNKVRNYFDMILADVPCSGEGMFRKSPEAQRQWSTALVEQCASLQLEIIDKIIGSLSPGGFLVYSTCTFNTIENERNVELICEKYSLETVDLDLPSQWCISSGVNTSNFCYRFLPSRLKGEGLFLSVLQKPGTLKEHKLNIRNPRNVVGYPTWTTDLIISDDGKTINGYTPSLLSMIDDLGKKVGNVIATGVEVAAIKGKDVIPSQSLALSVNLAQESFPSIDVDTDIALNYLRRQNIELGTGLPKGYILLKYNGHPLGFVKNIGNRMNNLYPSQWRIKHL